MKDFNWRRLAWVLITLASAVMIWVGLVLGAVMPGVEGFGWVMTVPLWATCLRVSIETLEYMAWERLTREHAAKLVLGVMSALADQQRADVERLRYGVIDEDDGARLMREIGDALEPRKFN